MATQNANEPAPPGATNEDVVRVALAQNTADRGHQEREHNRAEKREDEGEFHGGFCPKAPLAALNAEVVPKH